MIIKTTAFNPLKVEVNGMEVPVQETLYKDEDGANQKVSYVVFNGEKFPVEHRVELHEKLSFYKMDDVLAEVETKRLEKLNQ